MKHYFAPWHVEGGDENLGRKDAHSHCKHCGVKVMMSAGQTTTKFWVNGKWSTKRPPCETGTEPKCPTGYAMGTHENKDCNCVSREPYHQIGYMQGRGAA